MPHGGVMITPAHTQLLTTVLGHAAQIAGLRANVETSRQQMELSAARLEQERGMFDAKAGVLKELIGALVERRVEAVRTGFIEVLGIYVEQAQHFMGEQKELRQAALATDDLIRRSEIQTRISEIDIELRTIRSGARRLYNQMTEVVMRLGGDALALSPDYYGSLALPDLRSVAYG